MLSGWRGSTVCRAFAWRPARGHAARHRALIASLILVLGVAACTSPGTGADLSRTARPSHSPTSAPARSAPIALRITPAPYQLPSGVERETVLRRAHDLLIVGGLTRRGTTTAVTKLNPVTGRTTPTGRLAVPTHDAAGALLAGRPYVFGGGDQTSIADVQELAGGRSGRVAGRLPVPRSDLSAVTLGSTAYLVGGYDGATYDSDVLATANGTRFRLVAHLPVPVRYAAVAGAGNLMWVFGGEISSGPTDAIQQVNLSTGKAAIVGHLPVPLAGAAGFTLGGRIFIAGGQTSRPGSRGIRGTVLTYDPSRHNTRVAGHLPVPVSNAAAAVLDGTAFLIGGDDGQRPVPAVAMLRLTGGGATLAAPLSSGASAISGSPGGAPTGSGGSLLVRAPWLGPPQGKAHLAPGSNPTVLPEDVLIADHQNNRLVIVDPQGRIRWRFPRPGDLTSGQRFQSPDDAFFSPNGKYIVVTEEDYSVISVISIAKHKIIYRYGTPGVPGSSSDHVSNPDDAMMMPDGGLIAADIKNCRVLLLPPLSRRLHVPLRIFGHTGSCAHNPPQEFGSPNGAFPATNGDYVVTEINGDWADEMSLSGRISWSVNPPGVAYPSDTNEVYPGRYITVDYSPRGQVVEFNSHGRLLWRFGGLNHPSLALPLPNGDILVNDDYNDRVIVIDPVTNRIVWQYGHTGVASKAPGYLNDPDGVDLAPPDSLLIAHAATMGQP